MLNLLALLLIFSFADARKFKKNHIPKEVKDAWSFFFSQESFDGDFLHGNDVNMTNSFWGLQYVTMNNTPISDIFPIKDGYMNYNYKLLMKSDAQFPIGSNTKLFTAVAIYQLQEQGKLSVNDSVANYLNQNDFIKFGYSNITSWCPLLYNDWLQNKNSSNCQNITFIQLLSMTSGLVEPFLCPYDTNSTFLQFCVDKCASKVYYPGSIASVLASSINNPLTNVPGTTYVYNNVNYILAAYLIEKLSGLTYQQYLNQYIFEPLNLTNTYYDPWDSIFNVHFNRVDEYYLFKDMNSSELLSIGSCSPYMSSGVANGAGGIISTIQDLNTWYYELFNFNNFNSNLFNSIQSRNSLFYPYTSIPTISNTYYAQGVIVTYDNLNQSWPDYIFYLGSVDCVNTAIVMKPDANNLIVSIFSNSMDIYVANGENHLNELQYNASSSFCTMQYKDPLLAEYNSALNSSFQLMFQYE